MSKCWVMAMVASFVGTLSVASARDASAWSDSIVAMHSVAEKLKYCESAPENMSTMAQGGCYGDALEATNKILLALHAQILARLDVDATTNPDQANDDHETSSRLYAAQSAWNNYRGYQCSFEATSMLKGSGEAVAEISCELRLTQVRIKEFVEWSNNRFM